MAKIIGLLIIVLAIAAPFTGMMTFDGDLTQVFTQLAVMVFALAFGVWLVTHPTL